MEQQNLHSDFTCIFKQGSPYIEAELKGLLKFKKYEFLVDTGFSGHVSVPEQVAQQLGMTFWSLGRTGLANGSETVHINCLASMKIDGVEKTVIVSIMPNSYNFSVGMKFLETFDLTLIVNKDNYNFMTPNERVALGSAQDREHAGIDKILPAEINTSVTPDLKTE